MPLTARHVQGLVGLLTVLTACTPHPVRSPGPVRTPERVVSPPASPPRRQTTPAPTGADPREAAVLESLRRYREAMLAGNLPALLALVHPDYHDDAGTPDPSDDETYQSFQQLLRQRIPAARVLRFTLTRESLVFTAPDRAIVVARIGVLFEMRHSGGRISARGMTRRQTMVLRLLGGTWRFLKGM